MKIAISSDESNNLTKFVQKYLEDKGHAVVRLGAISKKGTEWVDASVELARSVAEGKSDEGVLFCWTGTGSSIAANKVAGIRAALCVDAKEARGARKWNHANVLVMSLRLTSEPLAKEILDAWFSEPYGKDAFDLRNVRKLEKLEGRRQRK
ncbi:MAG: RpiB/LacA/LacB family sugar-phosphate isomerase [Candidatus Micrarchaeota archaeon]|nr:RpiB/LacA/LacB family sugar-phosphate isomerase [Candidatus Micrarchaeota archaeon]MDE1834647.1 RpiB/LacA/LacB family sugar-phosphate isomerase [Candidatus Micrarchaeota archaeon]MDE1859642.1 RpiB/LacA/LacB family sugar-phosphate isomerase [Candidatus Micrarchaeota archaeon]